MTQWAKLIDSGVRSILDKKVDIASLKMILVFMLSKKLYPYCLVLVGSRNGFERDVTIELK